MAAPLDQLTKSKDSPLRFQPVDQAERQKFSQHGQEVQRFREQRQKLETNAAGAPAETRSKEFAPARVKLPGSPIVAKPAADLGKDHAPPKMHEAPKPDLKVEPKPRATRSADRSRPRPNGRPAATGQGPAGSATGGIEAGQTQGQRQELSVIAFLARSSEHYDCDVMLLPRA